MDSEMRKAWTEFVESKTGQIALMNYGRDNRGALCWEFYKWMSPTPPLQAGDASPGEPGEYGGEPSILFCPKCKGQHIDRDDWATRPHRKHLCEYCGHIWKASHVHTTGVFLIGDRPKPQDQGDPRPNIDRRFDSDYPVGSAGFEVLHCGTIEYRKMWLDIFKAEILALPRPPAPDLVVKAIDKALEEVFRICHERWRGEKGWRMSIPADPKRDSDLIIADALQLARAALAGGKPNE